MPRWEGIEDASAQAARVWLQRAVPVAETSRGTAAPPPNNDWMPLRKSDCQKLNQATAVDAAVTAETAVVIEMGRATAYPGQGRLSYNFLRAGPGAERALDCAIWFIVQGEKSTRQTDIGPEPSSLEPIFHKQDSEKIEQLYQRAIQAASSLGQGTASVMEESVELHDESIVKLVKQSDGRFALKKMPKGSWQLFSNAMTLLQRGYGEYIVPGEETEQMLGPVKNLVFVVHGIGEAFLNRDDFNAIPNLVETLDQTRTIIQEKQVAEWKQNRVKEPGLKPPNRVELVPIEWFDEFHDSSTSLMRSLRATTIQSIPALRAIANDVIFDVLMYLTPTFCQSVLECVTNKINETYEAFNRIFPDFESSGGKYSLMGHSLGSVIVWDLLSILKHSQETSSLGGNVLITSGVISGEHQDHYGYQAYAGHHLSNGEMSKSGTWGPSVNQKLERTLPFVPESTILLGSPCGIFLSLRGAHPVFDAMRKASGPVTLPGDQVDDPGGVSPQVSPFTLPTKRLYNIFHPSDPVAYRIEPLLLSPELSPDLDLPPPPYLTAPGKTVRLDLKAKQLHGELKKSLTDPKVGGWGNLLSAAVTAIANEVPAAAAAVTNGTPRSLTDTTTGTGTSAGLVFPLGGKSSRVDFSLQPGIVQNEYISAVRAHSSYFSNHDVLDFVIGLMSDDETNREGGHAASNRAFDSTH